MEFIALSIKQICRMKSNLYFDIKIIEMTFKTSF
jgi:hypothetical protein